MNEDFNSGSYNNDGSYNPEYTGGSKKKGFPWGKVIALMLVAALLGGAVGAGGVLLLAPSGSGSRSWKRACTLTSWRKSAASCRRFAVPGSREISKCLTYSCVTVPDGHGSFWMRAAAKGITPGRLQRD